MISNPQGATVDGAAIPIPPEKAQQDGWKNRTIDNFNDDFIYSTLELMAFRHDNPYLGNVFGIQQYNIVIQNQIMQLSTTKNLEKQLNDIIISYNSLNELITGKYKDYTIEDIKIVNEVLKGACGGVEKVPKNCSCNEMIQSKYNRFHQTGTEHSITNTAFRARAGKNSSGHIRTQCRSRNPRCCGQLRGERRQRLLCGTGARKVTR
ncbi:uncharacterized protein ASCRUDRAFT_113132 [Ascoidea rubescens DSM 1968]|uniref:Uncharacterized protein n=1 Tax=Ascoidea rubescens DSM 1968 TaxID=1344418 RepID=A0A1D2VBQ0_9ASCO|nr:hypothetical protein ASCRUDRAFT_113132 [Ascoidea rubescens DSM 1968]ODV59124.1 hypothetical protein ASCRUDRAFT_113132 [Ascoidea rubescens DSM 1968]